MTPKMWERLGRAGWRISVEMRMDILDMMAKILAGADEPVVVDASPAADRPEDPQ